MNLQEDILMLSGCDMIVGLTDLPEYELGEGLKLKHALAGDTGRILQFVRDNFDEGWVYEAQHAMMQEPVKCFVVTQDREILGFACYDSAAKGFFGPIGVAQKARKKHIGKALLVRTLQAMHENGYGYAIIGWAGEDAIPFYQRTVNAQLIQNGNPENSIYRDMLML